MSFTKELKSTQAAYPRHDGSTVLMGQRLKISYNKYTANYAIPENQTAINLIFAHGTGMNKALWNYHITRLYELGMKSSTWKVGSVISVDAVNHGDSALANVGKLGWGLAWTDHGRDIVEIVKHEQQLWPGSFENGIRSRNILVGHSFGGYGVIFAGFQEPHLFDSVVAIEPVVFYSNDPQVRAKFTAIFRKISLMLIDSFDSLEEYVGFFKQFSFYKKFHPAVLKDLIDDELYTAVDPLTGETKYKTKASAKAQVGVYVSAGVSLGQSEDLLRGIQIPVTHVVGKAAKWNPEATIPAIRQCLDAQLWKAVDVEKGEHLLNGELPDETVKIIADHIESRVAVAKKNVAYFPEIRFGGDEKKIFDHGYETLLEDKLDESMTFAAPRSEEKL